MTHFQTVLNDPVFKKIIVDFDVSKNVTIYWELHDHFNDPLPYVYDVFYNPDYSDPVAWRHFAGPVTNQVAITGPRLPKQGKILKDGFQIRLTTPKGTYTSITVMGTGKMSTRQWLLAKAAARRLTLIPQNLNTLQGILLKRKWYGPRCVCADEETDEITDITCQVCYGTGIVGGYWVAGQHQLIGVSTYGESLKRDASGGAPMVEPQLINAVKISIPPVNVDDVWVRLDTNDRLYVRSVHHLAELGGVPILSQMEMGPADYDDIIYKFPLN